MKIKDIDFGNIIKYGVELKYVEHKVADVEERMTRRLLQFFKDKFKDTDYKVKDLIVRGLCYNNIGGPQDCLVNIILENPIHKFGGAFFKLSYVPFENYKLDARGIRFTKLHWLNPEVPSEWDYIVSNKSLPSSVDYTNIH